MKVYKFGGASVKDIASLKVVADILSDREGAIIAVVSAMGKTTNALEELVPKLTVPDARKNLKEIEDYHYNMASAVKEKYRNKLDNILKKDFDFLKQLVYEYPYGNYDKRYDQIVSLGEMLSTHILSSYLNGIGIKNTLEDAGKVIITDNNYRNANVDFIKTGKKVQSAISHQLMANSLVIVQGFIGSHPHSHTHTTLGREGSDYTAAIIAHCAKAESVTIWKDVPGVLNADPKMFIDTVKIDHLNYQDAIELAYYGASVIHPKTIKPLQNSNIPLFVKPFNNPKSEGTVIDNETVRLPVPCFISKQNQVLLSLSSKDFSFIAEENLSHIFKTFAKHKVKVNMMQQSAINFSVCFDYDSRNVPKLFESFKESYRVLYNENAELFTIRYYNQAIIDKLTKHRKALLEQRSRYTVQLVVK